MGAVIMASHSSSLPQSKRLTSGTQNMSNASILLDKQKATLRRSTPDSEALASSDDEQDGQQRSLPSSTGPASKPVRRSSWMNDGIPNLHRKPSLGTSEPRSPSGLSNNSATPDGTPWPSGPIAVGRNHSGSTSLPWNSTIWNGEGQKGLPSRLTEYLSSPTNHIHSGSFEDVSQSPSRRDSSSEASIPFAIPLQPTLKSYRSQSYSVGQLDQDPNVNTQIRSPQHTYNGRTRAGSSYSGLQHRPSRPSVLGEFSADVSSLGQLQEVDDDEESTTSSDANTRFSNTQARRIEQLAMENAILRQRAQMGSQVTHSTSGAGYGSIQGLTSRASSRGLQISESVLEEPDDEQLNDEDYIMAPSSLQRQSNDRRPSEYSTMMSGQMLPSVSDQKTFINGKRGHWQSSLGFGGPIEHSQSRRHSFADVSLRHTTSGGPDIGGVRPVDGLTHFPYTDSNQKPVALEDAPLRSTGSGRSTEGYKSASQVSGNLGTSFSSPPHSRISPFGPPQSHHSQSLYLVTFKAARAEFYYVQEGTGLDVNPGDLVIVEADRGTDLGTVAHNNIDWASARELKEHYVAEHYNWLMMFSRQGQSGPSSASNGWNLGSYPERAGQASTGTQGVPMATDSISNEIKPKMIKRLAQPHEIHTLREKEGNEAKAKRMCQQKVAEHHLNMEILDAEFQMDWKKLTFYYFADSYINFNSLVTDLFKIYKTRIWMSAINPASFVSPSAGPHPPAGMANPIKSERHRLTDPRSKHDNQGSAPATSSEFDPNWLNERGQILPPNAYSQYWPAHSFQQASQSQENSYLQGPIPPFRGNTVFAAPYHPMATTRPQSKSEYKPEPLQSAYADQLQALQGLTLGHS